MKNKNEIYRQLLDDFFNRQLDTEFEKKVRHWLTGETIPTEADTILREKFDGFVKSGSGTQKYRSEAWEKRCRELGFIDHSIHQHSRKRFIRTYWRSIAAVLIPLLVISGYLVREAWIKNDFEQKQTVEYMVKIEAPKEWKKKAVLPDGSEIWLNAGATLEFDSISFFSSRNVKLTGEAFFTVVNNGGTPFVVQAGDVIVTVLGTEFNMKPGSGNGYEVSLFSGSLQVDMGGLVTLLKPGQQLIPDEEKGVLLKHGFDDEECANWWLALKFNNLALPEVFSMISDHFGIPLIINDSLPEESKIRVHFDHAQIEDVMTIIQKITNGFDYRLQSDSLIITARK